MAGGGGLANGCVLSLSDSCVKAGQAVMVGSVSGRFTMAFKIASSEEKH